MNDLTLMRKNLFRKKTRAILLLISIMIAFFIYAALYTMNGALHAGVESAKANRLVTVNSINFTVSLPFAYYNRIKSVEGVVDAAHASWFGGYYKEPVNQFQTFATDPEAYLNVYPELITSPEERAAFINTRDCLAVGRELATMNQISLGDRIPVMSNIFSKQDGSRSWEFEVCAIMDYEPETGRDVPANFALMHYDYYNEALAFNRDMLGWIIILTEDAALNEQVGRTIDEMFANSPYETETSTEAAFGEAFLSQLGNIGLMLTLVVGAAFVTILMIVGTTMVLAINERIKEIAVFKTLGFPAPRIFRMVMGESLLLCFFGGFLGIGFAQIVITLLNPFLKNVLGELYISWDAVGYGAALMLALSLITGLLPAFSAMNVRIVTALGKH